MKPDWEIISLISTAMGYPMAYQNTQQIWDEMRGLCPPFAGVTYEKLAGLGYVQWPCPTEDHPGTPYLYTDNQFATADGKGLLSCAPWQPPHEQTDSDYPLALCTVREVGHYSCRSMTGNCGTLKSWRMSRAMCKSILRMPAIWGYRSGADLDFITTRESDRPCQCDRTG